MVRLSVSSSTTLTVSFQEPQSLNSTVVTKYRGEVRQVPLWLRPLSLTLFNLFSVSFDLCGSETGSDT